MKVLVVGAGVLGSLHAVRLHDAGHDVSLLARGSRLAALRSKGLLIARGDGPVRRVALPVVSEVEDVYELVVVAVRAQDMEAALAGLRTLAADVLTLGNWAGSPQALELALGRDLLLAFPMAGGVMDQGVIRWTAPLKLGRLAAMPVGESGWGSSVRAERIVDVFNSAGFPAQVQQDMPGWLRTHAILVAPLGLAVDRAGGAAELAADAGAVRGVVDEVRGRLRALEDAPVPRILGVLKGTPTRTAVIALRRFLRTPAAALALDISSPAARAEIELLAQQLGE
ncbi:ketopantoate reductase family protein [Luteococcus sp.]|uniref:ketopantoate reductase family protein n=1 Tax=Luteococcus sp. TaxID=1969402 RepID=UPI0037353F9E